MLFALLLASTTPQTVDVQSEKILVLSTGSAIGHRLTDGALGLGQLSLSFALHPNIEPEVVVGLGGHAALPDKLEFAVQRPQMIQRFSFGTRFIAPVDEGKPFLWLALHHGHEVEWANLVKDPVGTTLSTTDSGVAHLTGGEAGLGVALPVNIETTKVELMMRVSTVVLPAFASGDGLDRVFLLADLSLGAPISF
jgi:hypothetical protein